MRAKVSAVVIVIFGLLGAVAIAAAPVARTQVAGSVQPADRGHGQDHDSNDAGECIAEDEVVVGPVCVEVDDVISDILST